MTGAEFAAIAFTVLNGLRLLGYVPQWIAIRRDSGRAESISVPAWTLWGASHASTALYAQTLGDDLVTVVMMINALACVVVVLLTLVKRRTPATGVRPQVSSDLRPVPLAAVHDRVR